MTIDLSTIELPPGFDELRPHQEDAVREIIEEFDNGSDVVYLDAPTGSGKTLIGEMIRRILNINTMYVCSDKSLQEQFARDFPYAKVLKGRANYPTQSNPDATAADCTAQGWDEPCWHCDDGKEGCPYELAKQAALRSPLAVTNTSYLLHEANYVGKFSGRPLIIADEADTLESIMMGFVEYRVPERVMREVRMTPPIKGARKPTLIDWLNAFADSLNYSSEPMRKARAAYDYKQVRYLQGVANNAARVAVELQRDIDARGSGDTDSGMWLREYDDRDSLILRPVMVSGYGGRNLWRHGRKWLLMSATIISADEMSDSLGLPLDYSSVVVPMTFPVENRPIILAPVANMIYKEMREGNAIRQCAYAIGQIVRKHPGDRVIVHTVSYGLARDLEKLLKFDPEMKVTDRKVITYTEGRDRDKALDLYRRTPGAIMLAPSMTRGIDLEGDACRVQIVAKVPFLALGDRVTAARTHLPGGQLWYTVQAIRSIVQMTGRAIRNHEDYATTYILDAQFGKNLWSKWKRLFPLWWQESVTTRVDVRDLILR